MQKYSNAFPSFVNQDNLIKKIFYKIRSTPQKALTPEALAQGTHMMNFFYFPAWNFSCKTCSLVLIRFDCVRLANSSNLFSNYLLNFASACVNMAPYIIQWVFCTLTYLRQQSLPLHSLILRSRNNLHIFLPPFPFFHVICRDKGGGED